MQQTMTSDSTTNITPDKSSQGEDGIQGSDSAFAFPSRPSRANHSREVSLITNIHQFRFIGGQKNVEKYAIHFTPEIPDNSRMIGKVTKLANKEIKEKLTNVSFYGNNIYSPFKTFDDLVFNVMLDEQPYEIKI